MLAHDCCSLRLSQELAQAAFRVVISPCPSRPSARRLRCKGARNARELLRQTLAARPALAVRISFCASGPNGSGNAVALRNPAQCQSWTRGAQGRAWRDLPCVEWSEARSYGRAWRRTGRRAEATNPCPHGRAIWPRAEPRRSCLFVGGRGCLRPIRRSSFLRSPAPDREAAIGARARGTRIATAPCRQRRR